MEQHNRPISIALICDDNYVTPTAVVIQSLIETKKPTTIYDIHIICASLSEENTETFLRFCSDTVQIHIISQDVNVMASLHTYEENTYCVATPAALFKFMLPELLETYDKVLYLDGDILVREDLSDLFDTELGDAYLAAVIDSGIMYFRNKFMDQAGRYFNSGVMLINLAQMRKDQLTGKLIQAKIDMQDSSLMDQNVFNLVCAGKVLFLPIRYNFLPINLLRASGRWTLEQLNRLYGTNYVNNSSLFRDAAIIHFASKDKPWKDDSVAFADDWFQYYYAAPLNHTLQRSQRADTDPSSPKISIVLTGNASDDPTYRQPLEDTEILFGPDALHHAAGQYVWIGNHSELPNIKILNDFYSIAVSNNLDVVFGDTTIFSKSNVYPSTCTGPALYALLTKNKDYRACTASGLYRRNLLMKHRAALCSEELFSFEIFCCAQRVKALNVVVCNNDSPCRYSDKDSGAIANGILQILHNNPVSEEFVHAAAINLHQLLSSPSADFNVNASLIVPLLALHTAANFPSDIAKLTECFDECAQLKKEKAARWKELQSLYKEKGERWKELQSLYKEKGERWKELCALRKENAGLVQEIALLKKENSNLHDKMGASKKAGIFPDGRICFRVPPQFTRFLSRIFSKFKRGV